MKKLIKSGLLGVALLSTVVANASRKVNITVSPTKQLSISITDVKQGEILSITDKNNKVIFADKLNVADSFTENVDLSSFKQGVYYLELKTDTSIKVTPIIVSPKFSKIIKGETKTFNTPVINLEGDIVNIRLDNESKNDVFVVVYEKGKSTPLDVINVINDEKINKKYSLSSLQKGKYEFHVSQGNRDYSTVINY